jgi:hypothetical protein
MKSQLARIFILTIISAVSTTGISATSVSTAITVSGTIPAAITITNLATTAPMGSALAAESIVTDTFHVRNTGGIFDITATGSNPAASGTNFKMRKAGACAGSCLCDSADTICYTVKFQDTSSACSDQTLQTGVKDDLDACYVGDLNAYTDADNFQIKYTTTANASALPGSYQGTLTLVIEDG